MWSVVGAYVGDFCLYRFVLVDYIIKLRFLDIPALLRLTPTPLTETHIITVPVAVFQGLPSNSVPLCLTSWENQKKSAKTSKKKKCRPPQVWLILGSNFQMPHSSVPHSSVQTIVRKYKHHGTTQPSYRSGRIRILPPRDECTLVRELQINHRTTAKDLVNLL